MCPVEETGRNSVNPSTTPRIIDCNVVIEISIASCGRLFNMLQSIYFFAVYPIFIATAYAFAHVIVKHERKNHIRHIAIIFGGAIAAWGIATFLKEVIAHPRPDLTHALFKPGDIYSFPSGHATFMFTLAFSMYSFDKRAFSILLVLAILTGIARVLSGVHYWYDIVAGAVLAWVVARVVMYIVQLISKKIYQKFLLRK